MLLAFVSIIISADGWEIAPVFGFFSLWVMAMSESFLLSRVKSEMNDALEKLRKKQETEVQDLLYFLRESKISANPLESWDGAKKFIDKMQFPAMILTSNHQIVKANERMTALLGRVKGELDGSPAHMINHPVSMSKIGELCAKEPHVNKKSMHTYYVYIHKSGEPVVGVMEASIMIDGGFFVVFHPSKDNVIQYEYIKKLTMINK